MDAGQIGTVASIVVIAGGVSGLVSWAAIRSWKGIKRLARFLDDYEGTEARPGVPARPGVMERLQTIDGRMASGDQRFDAIDARLGGVEGQLDHVTDEMPKNGKPLAEKIDALYNHLIANSGETSP